MRRPDDFTCFYLKQVKPANHKLRQVYDGAIRRREGPDGEKHAGDEHRRVAGEAGARHHCRRHRPADDGEQLGGQAERRRAEGLAGVRCAEKRGSVFHALRDLSQRYAEVVVDAGGRDSEELRTAMVAARVLRVPLRAGQPDLETSVHMNELVTLARGMNPALDARLVISMAPTNPAINEAAQARALLRELPVFTLSATLIRERKVCRDAIAERRGVVEMDNPKASAEIEALAKEIYGG